MVLFPTVLIVTIRDSRDFEPKNYVLAFVQMRKHWCEIGVLTFDIESLVRLDANIKRKLFKDLHSALVIWIELFCDKVSIVMEDLGAHEVFEYCCIRESDDVSASLFIKLKVSMIREEYLHPIHWRRFLKQCEFTEESDLQMLGKKEMRRFTGSAVNE
jgi:hypothetical protein